MNCRKKIGMITLYDDNYGTVLQATALYKVLSELQLNPTVIQYSRNYDTSNHRNNVFIFQKIKRLTLKQLIDYAFMYRNISNVKAKFRAFRADNLKFSDNSYHRFNINDMDEPFDAYVCGSDMIWSEEFINDWDFFYLGFAPRDKSIAYAPSFGKNMIADINKAKCLNLLTNIRFLSCREEAGVELIKNDFNLPVKQVIDPTMLLTKKQWMEFLKDECSVSGESYALCYLFGGYDGKRTGLIKNIFEFTNNQVKIIPMKRKEFNKYAVKTAVGPLDFLRLYKNANFVVTDTFHGMIFSLIFEKPFVVLKREDGGHWAKYADRMTSTLKMLGLENRYIGSEDTITTDLLKLDYSKITNIIEEKRLESIKYLSDSLKGVLENE